MNINALETSEIYGFAIFPVHSPTEDGCSCGDSECSNIGKHPANSNGCSGAVKGETLIKEKWSGVKAENYGIATGEKSGVFVIDVDGKKGAESLEKLENKHGKLPKTLTVKTARGHHYFFKHPGFKVKTRRNAIGDNIDIRGDGGYVVGPGSIHQTGSTYEFVDPFEEIHKASDWMLSIVNNDISNPDKPDKPEKPLFAQDKKNQLFTFGNEWSQDEVSRMLGHITPDIGYDEWYQVGMAIKDEGLPFSIWDNWSRSGSKYKSSEMSKKWNSFKGTGISLGTLVKMAKDGGWKPENKLMDMVSATNGNKQEPWENNPIKGKQQIDEFGIDSNETERVDIVKHTANDINTDKNVTYRNSIKYVMAKDIDAILDAGDFVQDLLGAGEFSVVYGESNCGKTFFMTDVAFHVAHGTKWRGKRVDQGGVIYIAMEGSRGIMNRIAAHRKHFNLLGKNMPMTVVTSHIDFLDPNGNISDFVDFIADRAKEMGGVSLVVVDTLARAIAGGDENSGEDMGRLVKHVDAIRELTGAHVCLVHHSGKNRLMGARGHSSLRAAVDTEIEISKEENETHSTIKVVKQREREMIDDMYFKLSRVTLGKNQYDEDVSSCVVEAIDQPEKTQKTKPLASGETFLFDSLVDAMLSRGEMVTALSGLPKVKAITYEDLYEVMRKRGYKQLEDKDGDVTTKVITSSTNTHRLSLRKKGKINFTDKHLWPVDTE